MAKAANVDLDAIMDAYYDGQPFEDIATANGLTVRCLANIMKNECDEDPDTPLTKKESKRLLARLRKPADFEDRWSQMQVLYRNVGLLN